MKILWLANIPSPYRVNFFNELGKSCDLTVLFEKKFSSERDDSWKSYDLRSFKAIFLKGKSVGVAEAFCPSVIKYLQKHYDHIVVTNFSDPTGILAILYLKLRNIPYELEGDGAFPGSGKGPKEWLKRILIKNADRYFSTAEIHEKYYELYGAKKSKICRYPFTSVYKKNVLSKPVELHVKNRIRQDLDIRDKYMVLSVGQIIYRKGYDVLIKAASRLSKNYGFYIVGGKPSQEYIELLEYLNLDNVHFIDFMCAEELAKYYEAADVFVHPTREDIWGLVINEAMAKGLPIITTDRCIAGTEMIINGKNGFIVEVGDDKAIAEAIQNSVDRAEMRFCALDKARKYTFEEMVNVHLEVWNNNTIKGVDKTD